MAYTGSRIKYLRKSEKLTQQELADAIGVAKSTISMYENDQREPDFETLETIADYFNVDMNYLTGWVSDPYNYEIDPDNRLSEIPIAQFEVLRNRYNGDLSQVWQAWLSMQEDALKESLIQKPPANVIPIPKTYKVPLVGTIACGQPILAIEEADETVEVPEFIKADFALRCKGDSMINSRIFDGDIVYVRSKPEVENGQIAAVRIGDEATLKKVYYNGQRLILRVANPLYADLEYEGEALSEVEILGEAVAFTSMLTS